jgi:hypothetical protein
MRFEFTISTSLLPADSGDLLKEYPLRCVI